MSCHNIKPGVQIQTTILQIACAARFSGNKRSSVLGITEALMLQGIPYVVHPYQSKAITTQEGISSRVQVAEAVYS